MEHALDGEGIGPIRFDRASHLERLRVAAHRVETFVNAPPDGYTLLLVGASSAINATLYEKLNFNFLRDITPVSGIMSIPFVMVVNPSFPTKTVSEFIAYARANPGKVNMASGGTGTAGHMSGELFKMMAGVNMVHVPYRGRHLH